MVAGEAGRLIAFGLAPGNAREPPRAASLPQGGKGFSGAWAPCAPTLPFSGR